jgi:hypothetical protein
MIEYDRLSHVCYLLYIYYKLYSFQNERIIPNSTSWIREVPWPHGLRSPSAVVARFGFDAAHLDFAQNVPSRGDFGMKILVGLIKWLIMINYVITVWILYEYTVYMYARLYAYMEPYQSIPFSILQCMHVLIDCQLTDFTAI